MFRVFDEYESDYVYSTYFENADKCENDTVIKDIDMNKDVLREIDINREIFSLKAVVCEFKNTDNEKSLVWLQLVKYPELFKYLNLQLITNISCFKDSQEFEDFIEFLKENFKDYNKISISIDSSTLNEEKINVLKKLGLSQEIIYKDELEEGKDLIVYSKLI